MHRSRIVGSACPHSGSGASIAVAITLLLAVSCHRPTQQGEASSTDRRANAHPVAVPSDATATDRSMVIDQEWSRPAKSVTNGSVYDVATLNIAEYRTVRVPKGASVKQGAEDGIVRVFMEKSLFFVGFPPKPIDLFTARRSMGCAWRADGGTLQLGTFGEWDSHIEGGAGMALLLVVPPSVVVEYGDTLSGEASIAAKHEYDSRDSDPDYWYTADEPASGWTALPSEPDPSRRALGAKAG